MEYVKYDNTDITDDIKQPNDNLLINSDFKSGIINQKGQTTYEAQTSLTFGIDMWGATMIKVTVNDGYVRFENNDSTSHSLTQKFDRVYNEEYTWYVNVKSATPGTYLWKTYSKIDGKWMKIGNLVEGDNIFCHGSTVQTFCDFSISIPAKGYVEIYQMKLEKGSYFTGMPVWDYDNELSKCIKKYISFIGQPTMKSIYVGQNYAVLTYELPFPIYKHPSIVIPDGTGMYWQNHDSAQPINTKITSGMVTGVAGNAVTIQLFGSFGNTTWKSAYMHGVGIAFDFNEY